MNKISEYAKELIDTPFHHQGRLKNVGIDCFGVLIYVLNKLGKHELVKLDEIDYERTPKKNSLPRKLDIMLKRKPDNTIEEGNVLCFTIKKNPQHLAIVTDIGMVHAYQTRGKVVEHSLGNRWLKRLYAVYEIEDVS